MTAFLEAVVRDAPGNKPAAASEDQSDSASAAAWTQAALVLLNSNEFIYVH
ncbi:MAG TPA: hypothetical protein VGX78_04890 [Pirellulales bacterium]|jgi:hypothetical protein|nr:hypothetical protein [Pirellulales bacterium]